MMRRRRDRSTPAPATIGPRGHAARPALATVPRRHSCRRVMSLQNMVSRAAQDVSRPAGTPEGTPSAPQAPDRRAAVGSRYSCRDSQFVTTVGTSVSASATGAAQRSAPRRRSTRAPQIRRDHPPGLTHGRRSDPRPPDRAIFFGFAIRAGSGAATGPAGRPGSTIVLNRGRTGGRLGFRFAARRAASCRFPSASRFDICNFSCCYRDKVKADRIRPAVLDAAMRRFRALARRPTRWLRHTRFRRFRFRQRRPWHVGPPD